MKILFLYYDPHYAHAEMEKALRTGFKIVLKQIIENYRSINLLGVHYENSTCKYDKTLSRNWPGHK